MVPKKTPKDLGWGWKLTKTNQVIDTEEKERWDGRKSTSCKFMYIHEQSLGYTNSDQCTQIILLVTSLFNTIHCNPSQKFDDSISLSQLKEPKNKFWSLPTLNRLDFTYLIKSAAGYIALELQKVKIKIAFCSNWHEAFNYGCRLTCRSWKICPSRV